MISPDEHGATVLINHEFLFQLLADSRQAQSSILISSFLVQLFDSKMPRVPQRLRAVLESAHQRGVSVRLLAGQVAGSSKVAELPFEARVFAGPELMHAKFYVVDSRICVVGGHNLSYRGTLVNQEVSMRLESRHLAQQLTNYHRSLWARSRVIASTRR